VKWYKPIKIEWLSFLILMPLLMLIIHYLFFGAERFLSTQVLLYSYPVAYTAGFIFWYTLLILQDNIRRRYYQYSQSIKRVSVLLTVHVLITAAYFVLLAFAYDRYHFLGYTFNLSNYWISLLAGMVFSLIASGLYEGKYILQQWKKNVEEKELLNVKKLQVEFETLKRQINPHFLFNSLNSLSSLIATDSEKAERFVEEMSIFYRYLLQNNQGDLVTLRKELNFIESYNHLLTMRFGCGYQPAIDVEESLKDYLIPPLTLQLLVENAVKHNRIDPDEPLHLCLYTKDEKLIVENNILKKVTIVASNSIGLNNIVSRYQLLNQPEVEILETDSHFTVVLPLIKYSKIQYSL
jgi:two-component system LytT family sensor kinase